MVFTTRKIAVTTDMWENRVIQLQLNRQLNTTHTILHIISQIPLVEFSGEKNLKWIHIYRFNEKREFGMKIAPCKCIQWNRLYIQS